MFEWTILIHNEVNRMLGKSEWSVKEAYNYYTNPFFNLKNSTKCFSNSYFLIVLLLIFGPFLKIIIKILNISIY